ncbi:MAG: O-antigen ligase family protein [Acidobacteriota bacterium]
MSAISSPLSALPAVQRISSPSSKWVNPLLAAIVVVWLISFIFDYYLSLSILTVVGLVAALVGLRNPTMGLVGIGMLSTLDAPARSLLSGGVFRYNTFNYVLILAIAVGFTYFEKLKDLQSRALQALSLMIILGVAVTPDVAAGLQHVLNVVAIFGMLVYFLRARSDPRILYNTALINGVLAGVGGLVFFLQIDKMPWLTDDAEGRFMNPNAFSYFPLTGLFSICLAYPSATRKEQTKLGVLALMTLLSVFLSGSRGAIIVGMMILLYLIASTHGFSRRLAFIGTIPILAILTISMFPSLQDYAVKRFLKIFDSQVSLKSRTSGRSDVAIVGWGIFLQHPLGVGTGGFPTAYGQADADEMAFAGIEKQAHSGWVKTLVENGVLGAITLGWYVFSFLFSGQRGNKRGFTSLGIIVTATIAVSLLGSEFQGKGLWYLACGATVLLNYGMGSTLPQEGQPLTPTASS